MTGNWDCYRKKRRKIKFFQIYFASYYEIYAQIKFRFFVIETRI
jgi:hypothetical protein